MIFSAAGFVLQLTLSTTNEDLQVDKLITESSPPRVGYEVRVLPARAELKHLQVLSGFKAAGEHDPRDGIHVESRRRLNLSALSPPKRF